MTLTTLHDLNALGGGIFLVALDIEIPSVPTVRVVNNGENINFNGNEYVAFPFTIGEISAGKGEVPSWTLQLDNTTRIIESYILDYDLYLKANGIDGNGISCTLYVLNVNDLSEAVYTAYFDLTSFQTDNKYATFNMGASNPFSKTYPTRRILQNFCGFKFKDGRCKYAGAENTCDKTLARCRELNNSINFGGFIGISRGVRI